MTGERLRFRFDAAVPLEDVAASLLLARWGAEGLHGEAAVQLDAPHRLDAARRECVFETATAPGRDLARLFLAFLRREFAPTLYRVERLPAEAAGPAELAVA